MTGREDLGSGRGGNRWRIAYWGFTALVLLVPLVAMPFHDGVSRNISAFIFAAVLLTMTGVGYEVMARNDPRAAYRAGAGFALAAGLLIIWIIGAVGIIGSEDEPANLLYGVVLAVGAIGSMIARFAPKGMARAMYATAIAHGLVGVIAVAARWGSTSHNWPWDILGLTLLFGVMFLESAVLLQNSARQHTPQVVSPHIDAMP